MWHLNNSTEEITHTSQIKPRCSKNVYVLRQQWRRARPEGTVLCNQGFTTVPLLMWLGPTLLLERKHNSLISAQTKCSPPQQQHQTSIWWRMKSHHKQSKQAVRLFTIAVLLNFCYAHYVCWRVSLYPICRFFFTINYMRKKAFSSTSLHLYGLIFKFKPVCNWNYIFLFW